MTHLHCPVLATLFLLALADTANCCGSLRKGHRVFPIRPYAVCSEIGLEAGDTIDVYLRDSQDPEGHKVLTDVHVFAISDDGYSVVSLDMHKDNVSRISRPQGDIELILVVRAPLPAVPEPDRLDSIATDDFAVAPIAAKSGRLPPAKPARPPNAGGKSWLWTLMTVGGISVLLVEALLLVVERVRRRPWSREGM